MRVRLWAALRSWVSPVGGLRGAVTRAAWACTNERLREGPIWSTAHPVLELWWTGGITGCGAMRSRLSWNALPGAATYLICGNVEIKGTSAGYLRPIGGACRKAVCGIHFRERPATCPEETARRSEADCPHNERSGWPRPSDDRRGCAHARVLICDRFIWPEAILRETDSVFN